ncbi:MAG: site-specific integrase [Thermoplasmata archaeon]|nr:site-specific integrase [Thermoplasmata archaeon]
MMSITHDRENRLFFMLGLDFGARVSEVASLKWSGVNWQQKYIVLWDEKKDRHRICTVTGPTWDLLREHADHADSKEDVVFPRLYKLSAKKRQVCWHMSEKTLNRRIKA